MDNISFTPMRDIRVVKDLRTKEKRYSPFVRHAGRLRLLRYGIKHPFHRKRDAASYGNQFISRYRSFCASIPEEQADEILVVEDKTSVL